MKRTKTLTKGNQKNKDENQNKKQKKNNTLLTWIEG
jgi:hypothetical protein